MRIESTTCLPLAGGGGNFRTTRWSVVLQAGEASPASVEALEKLCRAYWHPIFAYIRRHGHDVHAAQDLTQGFFWRFLADDSLARVHPSQGRFRSFLLAALKNFLANEWDRSQCLKRGGGKPTLSLDAASVEEREAFEPPDLLTPDKMFERRWAETLLARVNARLRREHEAAGQEARFDALKVYLLDDYNPVSYSEMAAQLGLSTAAVKSAIYKLRQRYGQMFRAEIAHTVSGSAEVEQEIQWLLGALSD